MDRKDQILPLAHLVLMVLLVPVVQLDLTAPFLRQGHLVHLVRLGHLAQ